MLEEQTILASFSSSSGLHSTNMSVNFTNDSHPPSNSSLPPDLLPCSDPVGIAMVFTAISTYILLVIPLAVFVLYLGSQQLRRQRSVSTAAVMSHSDFFTYNMAVIELIALYGYATYYYYYDSYTDIPLWSSVGSVIGCFTWLAQILFPILTCMEHYLAVVHPVTYLGLKQAGAVRIRNIITGCVWLMCLGGAGFLLVLIYYKNLLPATSMLIVSLVVMTFCSLSVLRVLIRPRPGEVGGDRVQVDQSKLRAIHTIIIIMGVLWLKFGGNVASIIVSSTSVSDSVRCLPDVLTFVFSLPSSLTLFLLYLHKAGKLPKCKHNTESG